MKLLVRLFGKKMICERNCMRQKFTKGFILVVCVIENVHKLTGPAKTRWRGVLYFSTLTSSRHALNVERDIKQDIIIITLIFPVYG